MTKRDQDDRAERNGVRSKDFEQIRWNIIVLQ